MNRLADSLAWQITVLTLWALCAIAAFPFASHVHEQLDATARLRHSDWALVEKTLKQRFHSPFSKTALLHVSGEPDPKTDAGRELLNHVVEKLKAVAGVQGVMSYADREDSLFLGTDESTILIVGLSSDRPGDEVMLQVRQTTDALLKELKPKYADLAFGWTGEAAVNADMRRMSAGETRAAELRVLPITVLLLLLAFRSVISALLPVLCGALTILLSLGVISAVNRIWPASLIVVSIISMVGLGLSIDYALLIVSRYRDALRQGQARIEALREASRHGGRTVLISGSAVAIGFAAMLMVPVSEVRSIGLGGLLVTTIAVLVASSLLPVALAWIGPWLDAARIGPPPKEDAGDRWRRWAGFVSRHPLVVLVVAGVPLLLLAAQAVHLRTDLPRGRWLPESAESVHVLRDIDSVSRGNFGQIMQVIVSMPKGVRVDEDEGWRATQKLVRHFAKDPRIRHVWSITNINVVPLAGPELLAKIPQAVRQQFITEDGSATVLELMPRPTLVAKDAAIMAREFRAANAAEIAGVPGITLKVGGVPSFNVDYEDAIKSSLGLLAAVVIGATLLVLSISFRSALIPLKAVALNLLSVAAAFGAVTLVFQDGYGAHLIGLPHALDGGFPILPVLVFCIVFGLSMDYEVFIVARIADERRAGLADGNALIEGMAGTGRVVTFAAAIMITIFGGFVFGEFVLIKMLGFALGIAVLLDASVIRLGVGPALIQLAGRWNWWPGDRSKP
jgi:RND superfamily putative drug exporter